MSNQANKSLFKLLNSKPVSFNPIYSELCGKLKISNLTGKEYLEKNQSAGVLLSQLLYWYSAVDSKEFYKTDSELIKECGSSEYAYQQSKKILIKKGFIKCESKHPRDRETGKILNIKTITHWVINEEMIMQEALNSSVAGTAELKASCNPSTQQFEEVLNSAVPIIKTENTTENTTENNTDIEPSVLTSIPKLEEKHAASVAPTLTNKSNKKKSFDTYQYIESKFSNQEIKEMYLEYMKIREAKKWVTTKFIIDNHHKELTITGSLEKALKLLEQAILKNWQSLKAEWLDNINKPLKSSNQSNSAYISNR